MTNMVETGIYASVATILLWSAATDIKERRIPNIQPLIILGLFAGLALLRLITGDGFLAALAWPLLAGILVFAFCTVLFSLKLMGGGDVKLMGVTALVAGPTLSPAFVFYVAIAGGVVALVMLIAAQMRTHYNAPPKVPYAVAIMASGVWVCFQKISTASA